MGMLPENKRGKAYTRFLSGILLLFFLMIEFVPIATTLSQFEFSSDDAAEPTVSMTLEASECCCCPVGSCSPERCCCNGDVAEAQVSIQFECQSAPDPRAPIQTPLLTIRWWERQLETLPEPLHLGSLELANRPQKSAIHFLDPPPPRLI